MYTRIGWGKNRRRIRWEYETTWGRKLEYDIYILQWYIPFFKRYDSEQQPVEIIED